MATELIAIGTSAATSADIEVADPVTVFLRDSDGGSIPFRSVVHVEIKGSSGSYTTIGRLEAANPATVISGPGTYRVRRIATGQAVGVDRSSE